MRIRRQRAGVCRVAVISSGGGSEQEWQWCFHGYWRLGVYGLHGVVGLLEVVVRSEYDVVVGFGSFDYECCRVSGLGEAVAQ